jgi:hypothetical protein
MNTEMHKSPERTLENKLEEVIEKTEVVLLLNEAGFSSAEELPIDVMDRLREIASLDTFDNLDTVKELLVTELQIFKLSEQGLSEDEMVEEISADLADVAKLLLSDNSYISNEEEAHLVLRSALKKSPSGLRFTDSLLESVNERKSIRKNI